MNPDDELLERLGAALAPAAAEPSPAEIAALRRAVAHPPLPLPRRPRWHRFRLPVIVGVALVASTGTAAAVGELPDPVRRAADAAGLPVDSVELVRGKDAADELRDALDEERDAQREAQRLQERLAAIDEDEQDEIDEEVAELLAEYERRTRGSRGPGPAPVRSGSGGGGEPFDDDSSGSGSGGSDDDAGDDTDDHSGSGGSGSSGGGSDGGDDSSGSGSGHD